MSWPVRPAGFLRAKGGVELLELLDLDFRNGPKQQAFPASVAEMAALSLPNAGAPSFIWLLDEATGAIVDKVASQSMTRVGGTVHQLAAAPFYDGTDLYSKPCIQYGTGAAFHYDVGVGVGDAGPTESVAVLTVFRVPELYTFAVRSLYRKTSPNAHQQRVGSGGELQLNISGGSNFTISVMPNHADKAWHYVWTVIDRNANITRIFTDLGSNTGAGVPEDYSGGNWAIGKPSPNGIHQIAYHAVWLGADAEGIVPADGAAFWTHGNQNTTPELTTYTRATPANVHGGAQSGFGARVAAWSGIGEQFAHEVNANYSHSGDLAMTHESAKTNFCLQSEDIDSATWAKVNATATAENAEAPDGGFRAVLLTSTVADGLHRQVVAGLAAVTAYEWTVYVKQGAARNFTMEVLDGATGLIQRAILLQTGATGIYGQGLTLWDRYTLAFTTGAAETTVQIDCYTGVKGASAGGETQWAWGHQVEIAYRTSYIRTLAATASRAFVDARLSNPSELYLDGRMGELEATFIRDAPGGSVRPLVDTPTNDRKFVRVEGTDAKFEVRDSGGSIIQDVDGAAAPITVDTETVVRARYQSTGGFQAHPETADLFKDATRVAGAATTWTDGAGVTELRVGHDTTNSFDGSISRIRSWNQPRPDTP